MVVWVACACVRVYELTCAIDVCNRPGSQARPGAGLKHATSTAQDISSEAERRRNRDRTAGTGSRGASSGGNYFSGGGLDQMRGGSGVSGSGMGGGLGSDKMRNLENLINPNVRNKMSEQDDRKAEQTKEQQQRRLRAKIPRSFARPVEQVLGVYNDASTNLYNVLGVGRTADEVALKKAYRNLALVLHPGVYVSGEWEGREGWLWLIE